MLIKNPYLYISWVKVSLQNIINLIKVNFVFNRLFHFLYPNMFFKNVYEIWSCLFLFSVTFYVRDEPSVKVHSLSSNWMVLGPVLQEIVLKTRKIKILLQV